MKYGAQEAIYTHVALSNHVGYSFLRCKLTFPSIEAVIKSHPGNKHGRWTPFVEIRSPSEATRGHSWLVPGGTALHIAACNKNSDALDILAAYGADMNAKAFDGRTPLHYAVNAGCITSTAKLLQHGATPRCLDSNRLTPFALASVAGKVELMSILFPFENDKTAMDIHGRTALHHAAQKAQLQAFIYLLDAGWDPYQLDRSLCSPIYYAISHPGLATYIHAKHLDISHLAADLDKRRELPLLARTTAARCFYIRLPKPARLRFLNTQATGQITPLMKEVIEHKIESMRILILAGADLEVCDPALGTALTISCHSGQLSSVRFLVRQGAKLDCKINGRVVTALQAASSYLDIIHWFLVDQYLDQGKITNDSEHENEVRPWSGVRNVQIPLRGRYERPLEVSLEDHARDLHSNVISRDGWRVLVPLGWDTVAHFTSLPAELGHRTSA
jgi:ankyrin repeat protein